MKITELSLVNFRGIQSLTLDLTAHQTAILIGKNGAGKSSVLDAAAIAMTRITAHLKAPGAGNRHLQATDINNNQSVAAITIKVEHNANAYSWQLIRKGRYAKKQDGEHFISSTEPVKNLAQVLTDAMTGEAACLPLLAYYPVNRAVLDIPLKIRKSHDFTPLGAFENALTNATNFRVFFEWFRNQEDIENERRIENSAYRDTALEAVRAAIQIFLNNCSNLRVRRNPLRMSIIKDGAEVLINQLSDGEKCLLALIGDIARRLAIANPHSATPLTGNGIVLIDEIELHLHPAWQRNIVHQLQTTFPNCQFIISTHSPQVLGDGANAAIYAITPKSEDLDDKENRIARLGNLYGADSNRILNEVMDADIRTSEISVLFKKLFEWIERKDWQQVGAISAQLAEKIDHDDPDLIKARMLIRLKGGS